MNSIDINFTKDDFLNNDYSDLLPDLYRLKSIVEKSDWHDNEDVFTHTLKTLNEIDLLLNFDWIEIKCLKDYWINYFNKKISKLTRLQVLRIATLIHDFGKYDTIIYDKKNRSSCPDHEIISANYVDKYFSLFNMSEKEINRCKKIVINHAKPDAIHNTTLIFTRKERAKKVQLLFDNTMDYWYDLLLLAIADTLSNQLIKIKPNIHHNQIDFFLRCFLGTTNWDNRL